MDTPSDLPSARNRPEEGNLPSPPASPRTDQARAREEEARDILAGAIKNQAEDGPSTRKAAIRAYRYLHTMVRQHGPMIQQAYNDAKEHAAHSKGPILYTKDANAADPAGHQPAPARASHNTARAYFRVATLPINLPDPWPLAKITINMGSASQWVSKMWMFFWPMNLCDTRWEPTPPSNYLSKKLPLKLYEQHSNTSLTLGRLTLPSCW